MRQEADIKKEGTDMEEATIENTVSKSELIELLEAHDGCGTFIGEGDDGDFEPCKCYHCHLAREVLK